MIRTAVAATLALALVGPASSTIFSLQRVERTVYLMGTSAQLQVYAATRAKGLLMLERAVGILESAEDELSTWRPQSAVTMFNRQPVGIPWHAGPRLCDSFADLVRWHAVTGGTFDPAIGSLAEAWDIHGVGRVPSRALLESARVNSGLHLIDFDPQTCTLTRRRGGVRLDVGAWGKGDALQRVQQTVINAPWMIDFGGQISVNRVPPDQVAWVLSIAHPLERQRAFLSVSLPDGSLSTSGGSERDLWVSGRRIAHHLDPHTGSPASFRGSVTVWHSSALAADALSTALFVMGPERGLPWAEANAIAACYIILSSDRRADVRMTSGFHALNPRTL